MVGYRAAPTRHPGYSRVGLGLLVLGLLLPWAATSATAKEKLLPANVSQMNRTDQRGFQWDPTLQGIISDGTSDCFDSGLILKVNGGDFNPTSAPLQTADGLEFVLFGTIGQIGIVRRLRLDPAVGAMRYVELLENNSKREVRVTVEVHSQLGGSAAMIQTDQGRAIVNGQLEKGETTVVGLHHGGSRPSVMFQLRGARTKDSPVVSVRDNRYFVFTWTVSIPAGRSTAILHSVAQRRWSTPPNAKDYKAELDPLLDPKWSASLPSAVRSVLVNHASSGGASSTLTGKTLAHQEVLGLARSYEVERESDAIVFLERDKPL
ncbi:MAG: hypothetical protein O2894_11550 [Planctomycetota bacterium]|nr:hypothetical protein [Planctomycetota bacterium]